MISVFINGTASVFESPICIADLVTHLALNGKRIAIECNREIVPRSLYTQYFLADGDNLEVVVAVGGG